MTVLSAQSIRNLCTPNSWGVYKTRNEDFGRHEPLITPFSERGTQNGKSFGLSACTYDCRIAEEELILEPMPFWIIAEFFQRRAHPDFMNASEYRDFGNSIINTKYKALSSTIEQFSFPPHVCGSVLDKSSYARVFVSAFNTHLDPGWKGFLTVELVNYGDTVVHYHRGDPVCQVKFEWLDHPTDLPYSGKYQNQEPGPQEARFE